MDSSVPLTCHDPKDLGLICLVKKRKIRFQILSNLKIQSWILLKKRTPSASFLGGFIQKLEVLTIYPNNPEIPVEGQVEQKFAAKFVRK